MKRGKRLAAFLTALVVALVSVMAAPEIEVSAAGKPGKTAITYLKSNAAGEATVKYKRVKGCKYQIQAAANSKMSSGKKSYKTSSVSKTMKLKAGKKYYVRVRAYKKVKGKTKYGKWSSIKNVTVKKETVKKETGSQASKEVQEVIDLVNKERKNQGLFALKSDAALQAAAAIRAKELEKKFDHTRPDGRDCFTVLGENGVSYMAAGENIAMGQTSAGEVVKAWMNSPGHRENILSKDFSSIGVGYYKDSRGVIWWVQLFIG